MRDGYKILLAAVAILLAAIFCLYAWLPVVGIFLGVSQSESLDWMSAVSSPRTVDLLVKSVWIGLSTGLIATLLGSLVASALKRVGAMAQLSLAGASLILHLVSPYLMAQSAIHLFGSAGLIWRLCGFEPLFSLFTAAGVVGVLSVWLIPLAMLVQLMSKGLPAVYYDELVALKVSWWKRLRLYWWPSNGRSFLLSLGICGLIAFWNYDVASMLRVNVFPIELMAAFGSFYDYEMAVSLAFIPVLASLFVIGLLIWLCMQQQWTSRLTERRVSVKAGFGSFFFVATLGLLVFTAFLGLVYGLWSQVATLHAFTAFLSEYQTELWNTVRYGSVSAAIVVVLTSVLIICGRLSGRSFWQLPIAITLACWLLPPVLLAIGWVSLWNVPVLEFARAQGLELYLIGIHSAMILIPMLAVLASAIWSPSHNEALDTTGCAVHLRILLLSNRLKGIFFVLAFAGFALVAREVTAGLLNVPPGGSTLAISIETLLHFEQPDRVAALCLAYLIVLAVVGAFFAVVGYGLDSVVKSLLAERLKA